MKGNFNCNYLFSGRQWCLAYPDGKGSEVYICIEMYLIVICERRRYHIAFMPLCFFRYLHNNLLKRIPPGSFRGMPHLSRLRLDSNALICDCTMLWFVRMMAEHSDMKIVATCYGPEPMTGVSLATMKEHNFHCRK